MTTEEFNNALKSLEISRKDFCEITGLAYSSVSNWHDDNRPVPSWVESWLKNYSDSLKFKKAKELFGCADKPE